VLLERWERIIQAKSVCHWQCTAHLKFPLWKHQKGACSTAGFRMTRGQAFLQMHVWPPKTTLNWKHMTVSFLKGLFYPVSVICWNYMQTSQKEQSEHSPHLLLNAQLWFSLFLSSLTISQFCSCPVTRKSFTLDRPSSSNF